MGIYLFTTMFRLELGLAKLHTARIPVMPYNMNTFQSTVTQCTHHKAEESCEDGRHTPCRVPGVRMKVTY